MTTRYVRRGACAAALALAVVCAAGVTTRTAAGQRSEHREIWDADYLRSALKHKEKMLASLERGITGMEHRKALLEKMVGLAEEVQKQAGEALASIKAAPERSEDDLDEARDDVELTDLELKCKRKELLAVVSVRDTLLADRAKVEAEIAVIRLKLKALDAPGKGVLDGLQEVEEKHAETRLHAAKAEQAQAQRELEAAEAKVAEGRKKVEILNGKVKKAKDAMERVKQGGREPKVGDARQGRGAPLAPVSSPR